MKILVVGQFKHEMYEKALFNAFGILGEQVSSFCFDQDTENSMIVQYTSKIQNRLLIGPAIFKINRRLWLLVKRQKPDLVFLYRSPQIFSKTVRKIKSIGCTVFSYNNDDPFSGIPTLKFWRHYKKAAFYCDHNFVYRDKNRIDFRKIGIENVSILKSYYIKENNFPIDYKKTLDVIFIGHFENDGRDVYIKALINAGVNITVFGDQLWKKSALYDEIKSVFVKPVFGAEYNETLNKAKIAIVFLSKMNSDTYTRRCFEIPSTKTLMLSEYTVDLNSMFEADIEAVYFKNPEDLIEKCKYLLNNPTKINEIAENGYKKVISAGHSIEDRAKEILKEYFQQKKSNKT